METYTKLQAVEEEEITSFEEPDVIPMPNASVLINFGENEAGKPTYKGNEISINVEAQTQTVSLDTKEGTIIVTEGFNNSVILYYESENLPVGISVVDIEFLYNGEYISIRDLHTKDNGLPYFYIMDKTATVENGNFLCSISYGGEYKGNVINSLVNYESSKVKVTYYTN